VLIFGANWCPDCRALDAQMHKPELASIIEKNFVIVEVDLGREDKTDWPSSTMCPSSTDSALAVLTSRGTFCTQWTKAFADAAT